MNDVRHLMAVGILIAGMLGPGAPMAFAGSSEYWKTGNWNSCPEGDDSCVSQTDDSTGETVYRYNSRNYEIHNKRTDGLPVAVHFYRNDKDQTYVDFEPCNSLSCSKDLPPDANGSICMETGVLKRGGVRNNFEDYIYGKESRCFTVNSRI